MRTSQCSVLLFPLLHEITRLLTLRRSYRDFLSNYNALCTLNTNQHNDFRWLLPGSIHPLHALMGLLLHLHFCETPSAPFECYASQFAVNSAFENLGLRVTGPQLISPTQARVFSIDGCSGATRIYCLTQKLKENVWRKNGWDTDGQGSPLCKLPEPGDGCPTAPNLPPRPLRNRPQRIIESSQPALSASSAPTAANSRMGSPELDFGQWLQWDQLIDSFDSARS